MISISVAYFDNSDLFDEFIEKVDYALPIIFYYDHHNLNVQKEITKKIKEFYFGNELTREKALNVTNVCLFLCIKTMIFCEDGKKVSFDFCPQLFGDGWFLAAMDSYLRLKRTNPENSMTYTYLLTSKSLASYSSRYGTDAEKFYGLYSKYDKIG